MSGGQYGSRGYLYQSTISVLKSLANNDWDYIELEPNTPLQKVDVYWKREGRVIKAVQIKSSKNYFEPSLINRCLLNLIKDAEDSDEYNLILIGECSENTTILINNINNRDVSKLIKELRPYANKLKVEMVNYNYEQMLHSIDSVLQDYLKERGYSPEYIIIDIIKKVTIHDFNRRSSFGIKLSRIEFEKLFIKYIDSFYIDNSSIESKKFICVYQKENELTTYRIGKINKYKRIFKFSIVLSVLLSLNYFYRPLVQFGDILVHNNPISIGIFVSTCIGMLLILKVSDNKFSVELKKHYPDQQLNTYESGEHYGLNIKIIEREKFIGRYRELYRIYELKNVSDKCIDTVIVNAIPFKDRKKLKKRVFFQDNISPKQIVILCEETIYKDVLEDIEDTYKFKLDVIFKGEEDLKYVELDIRKPPKTKFLLLNRYNYIPKLNRILPFEISWLKEEVIYYIKGWFKYRPAIYCKDINSISREKIREFRRDLFINKITRIVAYITIFALIILCVVGMISLIKSIYVYILK